MKRKNREFYSCFHIREDSRHTLYTDKMEFHVLELPKLPKELKEDSSDIELWGKFINAERRKEFVMLAEKTLTLTVPINICRLSVRIKKNGWNMKPGKRLYEIITKVYLRPNNGENIKDGLKDALKGQPV